MLSRGRSPWAIIIKSSAGHSVPAVLRILISVLVHCRFIFYHFRNFGPTIDLNTNLQFIMLVPLGSRQNFGVESVDHDAALMRAWSQRRMFTVGGIEAA